MKRSFYWMFTVVFLALLAVPGIAYLMGYEAENYENRPLAREAELVNRNGLNLDFPQDFDDWWGDHFGWREEMVTAFHGFTMAVFDDTLNRKVVPGKGKYLFYSETMDDYLDINLLADEEIQKAATVLRLQQEYCESLGADFLFMVAPNKNTVYPEYMADRFAPTNDAGNRESLYAALEAQGVDALDLVAVLIGAKSEGDLYYEQDTHWNERGAMIAYRAIMDELMRGAPYEDFSELEASEFLGYRGDLHNFVLPSVGGRLKYVDHGLKEVKAYHVDEGANSARDISFGTTSDVNEYRLLFFRDSFGEGLIPILSNGVGRVVYSQEFPYNYVFSTEAFDAVAIEIVERNIKNLIASAPLMPALEKVLPEGAVDVGATVMGRQRSGYTQLYGCYDGAFEGAIYLEVTDENGVTGVFEAFPVLDEQAQEAASSMASPQGFVLTLPAGMTGWSQARVYAVSH